MRLQIGGLCITLGAGDPVKAIAGAVLVGQIPWDDFQAHLVRGGVSAGDAEKAAGIAQQYLANLVMRL